MRSRVRRTLIALALLLLATVSLAEPTPLVVIVRTDDDGLMVGRLVAELSALGFDVDELNDRAAQGVPLSELGITQHAVALLRARGAEEIELWVRNPNTGQTAFSEVVTAGDQRGDDVVALRAVEVLRARLLRIGVTVGLPSSPLPIAEEAPPSPPTKPPSEPLLWVDLGPGLGFSPGGLDTDILLLGALRVQPRSEWSLGALLSLPLQDSELSASEGTALVSVTLLGASVAWHLVRGPWSLGVGPGAGAAFVTMSGKAQSDQFAAEDVRLVTAIIFGELGLSYRLSRHWRARTEIWFGSALPRVGVRFAGRDVAAWGRPFGVAGLGVELALPGS